jgi:hypothetical protein
MNVGRTFVSIVSVWHPCNFSVKNYNEIFYFFHGRNIPSFQYKMSLDRSTTLGQLDGLSIIFFDLHIPTLTSRLHCSDAMLQLSENTSLLRSVAYIHLSSAKTAKWTAGVWGSSFMYKFYSVGARTEPCGTPPCTFMDVDNSPPTETLNFLLVRN